MKVLVTGANGFVGQVVCQRLFDHGHEVVGAMRQVHEAVAWSTVLVGDIGPDTLWEEALMGVDVVIHLAARVHIMRDESVNPLAAFRQVNTFGTERLAKCASEFGVKRFIYLSSVKVNGEGGATNPQAVLSELDVASPRDPYAQSKWEAEQLLENITCSGGMELVVVRPPLVYGPNVKANFLRLLRWVDAGVPLPFGALGNKRSFVSLTNLADFLTTCVVHPQAGGEVFMVADGEDVSTPDLLQRVADGLGRKLWLPTVPASLLVVFFRMLGRREMIDRLAGSLRVDIAKAKKQLGWKPPLSLNQGLAEVTQWYLKEKEG